MEHRRTMYYPNGMSANNKPRYRVLSVIRKMNNPNSQQQQPMQQFNGQRSSTAGGQKAAGGPDRRYVQTTPPNRQTQQRNQNGSGGGGGGSKKLNGSSSITIEEVPNHAYLENLNNHCVNGGHLKVDEDKLPVFLIKLWNIVEDANLQPIVHWDESGASFHIADPYSFCRNVLPHFFKHNNLNSLIRQLNMYGFRKMTPLNQGGLTRTESDQDHLEFSHPCFVQGRPELLTQIKRKKSSKETEDKQVNEQTQQSLDVVMSEMRSMREKAKNMEDKMNKLTKENRDMWNQMGSMRQQHARQQQYFKKLLHFLVSVMQPGLSKRVAKRFSGVLGIDFGANNLSGNGTPNSKRSRMNSEDGPYKDVCDLLESLQRESQEPFNRRFNAQNHDHEGPLISEVTDEFGNSPAGGGGRGDLFGDFGSRYSEATSSREASPHPRVSPPHSNQMRGGGGGGGMAQEEHKPEEMYMGSGALTHENIHRPSGGKRDYEGHLMSGGAGAGGQHQNSQVPTTSAGMPGQKRAPYKHAHHHRTSNGQTLNEYQPTLNDFFVPNAQQLTSYQPVVAPPQTAHHAQKLMAIEDNNQQQQQLLDPHQNLHSPTLHLSPSMDRQLSQDFQDYFTGFDSSMDSMRDFMTNMNWDTFGDNLPEDHEQQQQHQHQEEDEDDDDDDHYHHDGAGDRMNGGGSFIGGAQGPSSSSSGPPPPRSQGGKGGYQQYPLALKNVPESSFYDQDAGDILDPLLGDTQFPDNGFQTPYFQDQYHISPLAADDEIFPPRSPALRTPSPSAPNLI